MKKLLGCVSLIALATAYAAPASAQTIDYGSLQDLFGEPVTTSATGKPQKASEAPVAMEIITADQIRRSGAQTIPEVLGHVNGVTNWQSTRSFSDIGIRGQNASFNASLLVLVNGRQVYLDTYGYTDWSLIPVQMEEIRQIEVVKGPNTALFGFNAASGVINIITYNPKYDNVKEAGVTVGTDAYEKVHGVGTFKLSDDISARISGSQRRMNDFEKHSKTGFASYAGGPFKDYDELQNLNADTITQLGDKTQLRVEGNYTHGDENEMLFYKYAVVDSRSASGKATLTTQTDYGLVEASLYRNYLDQGFNAASTAGAAYVEQNVTVAQLQDLFKVGTDHSFRVMAEYRYNTMSSDEIIGVGNDFAYDSMATGAMWNWAINPQWELTNALRFDSLQYKRSGPDYGTPYGNNDAFDKRHNALSANSGVVYKATDNDTFRLSYGRGVQTPSLISAGVRLNSTVGGIPARFAGNPRLDPTIQTNYELGYDRLIKELDGKFRGSVFYKTTEDLFFTGVQNTVFGGPLIVSQSMNIGKSETHGIELGLNGKVTPEWTWDLGYIYQTSNDEFSVNNGTITVPLRYEDTIPHHVFKGHLGYATGPWETDLYGEIGSNFKAFTPSGTTSYGIVGIDGYQTLGARVGYKLPYETTVALSGSALNQGAVTTNGGFSNDRQVFLSLSKKF